MKNLLIVILCFTLLGCANQTQTTNAKVTAEKPQMSMEDYAKAGITEESIPNLKAVPVGAQAPDFTAKDQDGNAIQLSEMTQKGDVVLVFYRGYWCPICTKHLGEFVEELDAIRAKGAEVIAIAPEGSLNIDKTVKKTKLDIPFISDSDNEIMQKYGVAFKVTDEYNKKVKNFKGKTLNEINGQDDALLPIPATYIIGKGGKVKWSHFDPNYRERSEVADVLAQL